MLPPFPYLVCFLGRPDLKLHVSLWAAGYNWVGFCLHLVALQLNPSLQEAFDQRFLQMLLCQGNWKSVDVHPFNSKCVWYVFVCICCMYLFLPSYVGGKTLINGC